MYFGDFFLNISKKLHLVKILHTNTYICPPLTLEKLNNKKTTEKTHVSLRNFHFSSPQKNHENLPLYTPSPLLNLKTFLCFSSSSLASLPISSPLLLSSSLMPSPSPQITLSPLSSLSCSLPLSCSVHQRKFLNEVIN